MYWKKNNATFSCGADRLEIENKIMILSECSYLAP